jgi:hypothetical protein
MVLLAVAAPGQHRSRKGAAASSSLLVGVYPVGCVGSDESRTSCVCQFSNIIGSPAEYEAGAPSSRWDDRRCRAAGRQLVMNPGRDSGLCGGDWTRSAVAVLAERGDPAWARCPAQGFFRAFPEVVGKIRERAGHGPFVSKQDRDVRETGGPDAPISACVGGWCRRAGLGCSFRSGAGCGRSRRAGAMSDAERSSVV